MAATISLIDSADSKKRIAYGDENMKVTELFLAELERESAGTRHALERVPEGHNSWKPHPKSMEFGYLAALVATMPAWIVSMVKDEEFDLQSAAGKEYTPPLWTKRAELLAAHDASIAAAREALAGTTDEHLATKWKFMAGGHVISQNPRHQMIRDSVFNHLAHHRGQLTVYLRLNEASVPAIYGPSADEGRFAKAS
jgi:uncharacterized damage-inducible protein DinB